MKLLILKCHTCCFLKQMFRNLEHLEIAFKATISSEEEKHHTTFPSEILWKFALDSNSETLPTEFFNWLNNGDVKPLVVLNTPTEQGNFSRVFFRNGIATKLFNPMNDFYIDYPLPDYEISSDEIEQCIYNVINVRDIKTVLVELVNYFMFKTAGFGKFMMEITSLEFRRDGGSFQIGFNSIELIPSEPEVSYEILLEELSGYLEYQKKCASQNAILHHSDFRRGNIMYSIGKDNTKIPKLIDFGVSSFIFIFENGNSLDNLYLKYTKGKREPLFSDFIDTFVVE